MISYEPFWTWHDEYGVTTYTLIKRHKISASLIQRMREGKPISTSSLDKLCKAMNCPLDDIVKYIPDENASSE